eukprot:13123565-Ditylum_brightwellii.AAC.1
MRNNEFVATWAPLRTLQGAAGKRGDASDAQYYDVIAVSTQFYTVQMIKGSECNVGKGPRLYGQAALYHKQRNVIT